MQRVALSICCYLHIQLINSFNGIHKGSIHKMVRIFFQFFFECVWKRTNRTQSYETISFPFLPSHIQMIHFAFVHIPRSIDFNANCFCQFFFFFFGSKRKKPTLMPISIDANAHKRLLIQCGFSALFSPHHSNFSFSLRIRRSWLHTFYTTMQTISLSSNHSLVLFSSLLSFGIFR